jgi:long-chain acyl-CoA synthetase
MGWPNISEQTEVKAARFRDRVFLSDFEAGTSYTFGRFVEITDRMSGAIRTLGVAPGDRVALLHPNHSDLILAYFAIVRAGAVAVPINPLYTPREISYILQDSGACCLVSTRFFLPSIEEVLPSSRSVRTTIIKQGGELLADAMERQVGRVKGGFQAERDPDDLAFIFYTSGTTGNPKGVMLTHRNITFGGANTAQNYGLHEDDTALVCLPLVHIFANASPVLGSLNSGGRVVVMERFQTEAVFQALEREKITWFSGVPTMFGYLLNGFDERRRRTPFLRMGLSGGASLSADHLTRFESRFQVPVLEVYGLTESTGLVTGNPVHGVRKTGSIGISVSGVSVRLAEESGKDTPPGEVGEIVFRGPNATPGYWKRPDITARAIRNGWVHTGDMACQDTEGYYYVTGRKDELIICGGYNVYPREIEEVLFLHEGVAEAAVVGVSDERLGKVPRAFVTPKPGALLTANEVRSFCEGRLAAYKIPRDVEILEELPKNSTGKILKGELARK